jgi:multidrug efflux pump subunit AcrB
MEAEPKSAVSQVMKSLDEEVLPEIRNSLPDVTWSFQGTQADMRESTQVLWSSFAMAMLLIFALAFGIVEAVIGHILLGHDLSLVSLMGIIAL